MFFDGWNDIARVIALGSITYVLLVGVLRVLGNRTLAKMSAFDLVVTVALGSTLATIALSSDVSLAEGAVALLVLVSAQYAVAWTATRSSLVRRVVNHRPVVIVRDGRIDERTARTARVTANDIRQATRNSGVGSLDQVAAVVLETDGSMSVITRAQIGDGSAMPDEDGHRLIEGDGS